MAAAAKKRARASSSEKMECPACMEDKPECDFIALCSKPGCPATCLECVVDHLSTAEGKVPGRCMTPDCRSTCGFKGLARVAAASPALSELIMAECFKPHYDLPPTTRRVHCSLCDDDFPLAVRTGPMSCGHVYDGDEGTTHPAGTELPWMVGTDKDRRMLELKMKVVETLVCPSCLTQGVIPAAGEGCNDMVCAGCAAHICGYCNSWIVAHPRPGRAADAAEQFGKLSVDVCVGTTISEAVFSHFTTAEEQRCPRSARKRSLNVTGIEESRVCTAMADSFMYAVMLEDLVDHPMFEEVARLTFPLFPNIPLQTLLTPQRASEVNMSAPTKITFIPELLTPWDDAFLVEVTVENLRLWRSGTIPPPWLHAAHAVDVANVSALITREERRRHRISPVPRLIAAMLASLPASVEFEDEG